MEAATTTAPQAVTRPVERRLPPGPPLPRAVQTGIWSRQARRMLFACHERYGDMFTLRIAYEGTWVMLADPEAVKQVFTGDPRVYHAGEGNQILAPILGRNSILVLDEKPHMSQRRLLLPPFHGERMQGYEETMSEIAAQEIASGRPAPLTSCAHECRRSPWTSSCAPSSASARARGWSSCATLCATSSTSPPIPGCCFPVLMVGPERVRRLGPVPAAHRPSRPPHLPRDRRAPTGWEPGGA